MVTSVGSPGDHLSMPRKVLTSFVSCLSPCTGLSEGEFVSLGYFEKEDLKVLITHLR